MTHNEFKLIGILSDVTNEISMPATLHRKLSWTLQP